MKHSFIASNGIGGIGESIFFSLLSRIGKPKSVTSEKEWQKKGVDFTLSGIFYDSKFDTKAASTHNIAIETVSRRAKGKETKLGWAHTSEAHCIAYIFLDGNEWSVFLMTQADVKKLIRTQKDRETKIVKNFGSQSEVILIPLSDLSGILNIRVPVVGAPSGEEIKKLKKFHNSMKNMSG